MVATALMGGRVPDPPLRRRPRRHGLATVEIWCCDWCLACVPVEQLAPFTVNMILCKDCAEIR